MAKQPTPKKPVVRAGQNKPVADKFHPDPDHRRSKPISKPVAKKPSMSMYDVEIERRKSKPIMPSGKPKIGPDKSDKNISKQYKPISKTKGGQTPKFPR